MVHFQGRTVKLSESKDILNIRLNYMDVSKNRGTLKSSILIGVFSIKPIHFGGWRFSPYFWFNTHIEPNQENPWPFTSWTAWPQLMPNMVLHMRLWLGIGGCGWLLHSLKLTATKPQSPLKIRPFNAPKGKERTVFQAPTFRVQKSHVSFREGKKTEIHEPCRANNKWNRSFGCFLGDFGG